MFSMPVMSGASTAVLIERIKKRDNTVFYCVSIFYSKFSATFSEKTDDCV